MLALGLIRRTGWLMVAVVVLASAGFVVWAGVADSDSSVTATQGSFTLTCPDNSFAEGETLTCTLANTSAEAQPWPVVAILHLSSDEDRALVRGSLIDAAFGSRSPAADLDNGVEWIGDTLVGYSRFDWPGKAGADPSTTTTTAPAAHTRTVRIVANDDDLKEGTERFYIALGPDGSRGVGMLYNNRQRVSVTEDDAESSNNELSSLKLTAGRQDHTLSVTGTSHSVTVEYGVTEATLTAETAHLRASMTISASHGGSDIDLNGRGGTVLPVLSGEESLAVPLAVGTTAVTLTVTAEDGTANTHRIDVARQALGTATTVEVSTESFTLTCPATTDRGSDATCTLVNTSSSSAPWPVVAIIHSSADPDRALVAEDPIIPDTDPTYSQDVSLAATQVPAREDFNYGYGELFSGGSHTVYRTYGYEKFDWPGDAATGASRRVVIQLHAGSGTDTEVFYVAVAPSDYTGLSQLVDNKAPVLVAQQTPDPSVSGVSVDGVTQTSATVTVTVADPASGGTTLHLRHRPSASQGPWTTTSKTATTASAEFTLSGLTHSTAYTVQASFDSSFATGVTTETFTTANPVVGFGSATYRVTEGDTVTVELRLSAARTRPVRFEVRPRFHGSVAWWDSDYSLGACPRAQGDPPEGVECDFGVGVLYGAIPAGETVYSFDVRTIDDDRLEGAEPFTLWVHVPSRGVELGDNPEAVVTIADNDRAEVIVSASAVSVDEETSEHYTVKLGTEPAARGRVSIHAVASNPCKVKVSPARIDLAPGGWDDPHTFSVHANHDYDASDEEVVITHRIEADPGSGYGDAQAAPVAVSVADKHSPGVIVEKGSVQPDVGATARYRVYLNADPSKIYAQPPVDCYDNTGLHTVTVTATSSKPAVASVSPASVTFTGDAFDPQSFTVTGESVGNATITHTVTGTDPDYTGGPLVIQTVTVAVAEPPAQQQTQAPEPPAQQQTQAPEPQPAPTPGPVQELELVATADTLTASWRAPNTGEAPTGYIVRLSPLGTSKGALKTPKAKKTSVTFRNLQAGTAYKIWVRARNETGKGPRSYLIVTLPDAPPSPTSPPTSDTSTMQLLTPARMATFLAHALEMPAPQQEADR